MELHLGSMENITCWAFRSLCKGATDSYSGIMSMQYLVQRHKAWREADFFLIKNQKQWLQVATSKEEECKEFIKVIEEKFKILPEQSNCYGIQLNCSCPSPMFVRIGQGPALVRRASKVYNLLKELLKQDAYKVSVKTRLGLDFRDVQDRKIFSLFDKLEELHKQNKNFTQVVVHFKHGQEPSYSKYNFSLLKPLLDYNIPMVINGGINSLQDFNNLIKQEKVYNSKNLVGFMMARQALANPDCFIQPSNILNKTNFQPRTQEQLNKEFQEFCNLHEPKEIYLKKISNLKWRNKS